MCVCLQFEREKTEHLSLGPSKHCPARLLSDQSDILKLSHWPLTSMSFSKTCGSSSGKDFSKSIGKVKEGIFGHGPRFRFLGAVFTVQCQ